MKKICRICILVLVALASLCLGACKKEEKAHVIKVGSSGPLAGSISIYGLSVKEGLELGIQDLNDKGGVTINGEQYLFELVDFLNDDGDPTKAANNFNKLMDKGVNIVVGAVTSGATEGLIGEAVKVGVPVITPSGTADKLTVGENGNERDVRYNIYRACFYDSYQGITMADYAYANNMRTAYVLYNTSDDYSVGLQRAFVTEAQAKGLTVSTNAYDETIKDFGTLCATIVTADPDCVFLPDYYENVYAILMTLRGLGYTKPIYGADGWDGVVNQLTADANKAYLENCFYCNHYFSGSQAKVVSDLVTKYTAKYGEAPKSFAVLAYDAINIMAQAIEKAQSLDYDKIIEQLDSTTFTGLVTSDSLTFKDGNPQKSAFIITFRDGAEVEAAK